MKRVVKASSGSADLYIKYIEQEGSPSTTMLRSMTIKRPTLTEALEVLLDHIDLGSSDIYDLDTYPLTDFSDDANINALVIANSESSGKDTIVYMENRATGDVFIDQVGPEENY